MTYLQLTTKCALPAKPSHVAIATAIDAHHLTLKKLAKGIIDPVDLSVQALGNMIDFPRVYTKEEFDHDMALGCESDSESEYAVRSGKPSMLEELFGPKPGEEERKRDDISQIRNTIILPAGTRFFGRAPPYERNGGSWDYVFHGGNSNDYSLRNGGVPAYWLKK